MILDMNKLMKIIVAVLIVFPATIFAQGRIVFMLTDVKYIINTLIIVVAAIALLVFFWGLVRFIFKIGGSEDAVKEGRTLMIWGLVALFVMISVWGIVRFMQGELLRGVDYSNPVIPSFRP
ncbi:MAG: hypothetical protein Q8Q92_04380 [bacterium]|nr:hypothetical protein [bacterium]